MVGGLEELNHGQIIRCWLVPGVDNEDSKRNILRIVKILLHQLRPAVSLSFRDISKAISRQVDKEDPTIHLKIIDMDGLSGCVPDAGKIFSVQDTVDDRAFANIGTTGKDYFGARSSDKLFLVSR